MSKRVFVRKYSYEGTILDPETGGWHYGEISITDGMITDIVKKENIVSKKIILTQAFDCDANIFYSLLCPSRFAQRAIAYGVTNIIAETKPIVKVMGMPGADWLSKDSRLTPVDWRFIVAPTTGKGIKTGLDEKQVSQLAGRPYFWTGEYYNERKEKIITWQNWQENLSMLKKSTDGFVLGSGAILPDEWEQKNVVQLAKQLIAEGIKAQDVYKMLAYNPTILFEWKKKTLKIDDKAHLVVLNDDGCEVVWIDGKMMAKNGKALCKPRPSKPKKYFRAGFVSELNNTDNTKQDETSVFRVDRYNNSIENKGVVKMQSDCAIAGTNIGSDYDIVGIGNNSTDIAKAINEVVKMRGGIALVKKKRRIGRIFLTVAGLLTTRHGNYLARKYKQLKKMAMKYNFDLDNIFGIMI